MTSGTEADDDLRKILADIYYSIGEDLSWGRLAYLTEPEGDRTDLEHRDRIYGETSFKFYISFRTEAWDPYSIAN